METTDIQPRTTITELPFSDDDPRAVFARAVATGTDVIGGVRLDQLDLPTPCDDFTVRDLLAHLVDVLRRVAALGRGEEPFALPPMPDVADDGWRDAWLAAAHDVQAAWTDDATLDRTIRLPWAEMTGGVTLVSYVSEITVHTWDLAHATGQQPAWNEQVVGAALDISHQLLPGEGRAEIFAAAKRNLPPELRSAADPFAEAVPVPDGAPTIDRLVAWNGRRP